MSEVQVLNKVVCVSLCIKASPLLRKKTRIHLFSHFLFPSLIYLVGQTRFSSLVSKLTCLRKGNSLNSKLGAVGLKFPTHKNVLVNESSAPSLTCYNCCFMFHKESTVTTITTTIDTNIKVDSYLPNPFLRAGCDTRSVFKRLEFKVFLLQNQLSYLCHSSSCRAGSTDIPDPLSPLFPIVHRLWQVFWTTSRILT